MQHFHIFFANVIKMNSFQYEVYSRISRVGLIQKKLTCIKLLKKFPVIYSESFCIKIRLQTEEIHVFAFKLRVTACAYRYLPMLRHR